MRFLHAADIHLDSPLCGLDAYEGAPAEAIRGAARKALQNMVQAAVDRRVDLVVIAGDVYDGDWPDFNTGMFFVNQTRALERAGIPVVAVAGNHDAASVITRRLTLPPNVTYLPADAPATRTFEKFRVAVHGQGYASRAETRNLAASYPPPAEGFYNIGLLHTALDGREGHLPYAPCTPSELAARGYDYWALGHVHARESLGDGRVRIEYPGILQGRHAGECGPKGCLLVTVGHGGASEVEFVPVDVFRWSRVAVDAAAAAGPDEVRQLCVRAVSDAREVERPLPGAVRVEVRCREAVRRRLHLEMDRFRADLAGGLDDTWLEKVRLVPFDGAGPAAEPEPTEDAEGEIEAVLSELRGLSEEEAIALYDAGDCQKLLRSLPAEARDGLGGRWDELLERAAAHLLGAAGEAGQ